MKHIIFALIAVALTTTAMGQEGKAAYGSAPLDVMFSKYGDYLDLAEKGTPGFRPLYRALSKQKNPGPIIFEFEFEGKTYREEADWEGFIDFRPTRAMLEANPTVTVNQPKGTMAMNVSVGLDVELKQEYDLQLLLKQTQAAWKKAKKLGGFLSFLAPKHTNLLVIYEDSCEMAEWTVTGPDDPITESGRETRIPFKNKKARKAERLTTSCKPKRIVFE